MKRIRSSASDRLGEFGEDVSEAEGRCRRPRRSGAPEEVLRSFVEVRIGARDETNLWHYLVDCAGPVGRAVFTPRAAR